MVVFFFDRDRLIVDHKMQGPTEKLKTSKLVCDVEDDLGARSDNHNYGRKEVKIY